MSRSKPLRIARWIIYFMLLIVLSFGVLLFVSDWKYQRSVKARLEVAKAMRIGESTLSDVARMAASRGLPIDVRGENKYHMPTEPVPPSTCATGDCSIFVGYKAPARSVLEDNTLLSRLQVKYPRLRRFLRVNIFTVLVSTRRGVVRGVEVVTMSVDDHTTHEADTQIQIDSELPGWRIRQDRGALTSTELGGAITIVAITANSDVSPETKTGALNFDLGCFHWSRHCTSCELLPFACEQYDQGNWDYFEFPPKALQEFRSAVNAIPMGIHQRTVESHLCTSFPITDELSKDKLPYAFPDNTMFTKNDPRRLIYYVKRWRKEQDSDSRDRTVTFEFDKNERLVRITSQVDGIPSRP